MQVILTFSFSISSRSNAHLAGVGEIFDRVLIELVGKMKEMRMVRKLSSYLTYLLRLTIENVFLENAIFIGTCEYSNRSFLQQCQRFCVH